MAKEVDYFLQDGAAMDKTIDENFTILSGKGFTELRRTKLKADLTTAKEKNASQIKAVKFLNEKTIETNNAQKGVLQFIVKIQNACRSAFGNDPAKAKKYRIGDVQPRSVGATLGWGNYFQSLLIEDDDALLENGLIADDVTGFNNFITVLSASDTVQENAKKMQQAATIARDTAIDVLKDDAAKIRAFVKSAFADNKEMQVKFKPIPKGHGGGGGNENGDGENPPSPVA